MSTESENVKADEAALTASAEPQGLPSVGSEPQQAGAESIGAAGASPEGVGAEGAGAQAACDPPGESPTRAALLGEEGARQVEGSPGAAGGVAGTAEGAGAPEGVGAAKMVESGGTGEASEETSEEEVGEIEAVAEVEDVGEVEEVGDEEVGEVEEVQPLELIVEPEVEENLSFDWYILKVQVNREDSIRDALIRRVKVEGREPYFKEVIVPTEDVAEFTKTGKRRVVKRKLYPGYIMVNMHINDETWFLVRETPGIGDFTGSAGKPTPMLQRDVERILNIGKTDDGEDTHVKTAIPFKQGDRVRVKDGYFQNFEGDVESVDEANGRVTVMINIFGRSTPVELEHWQIESV